MNELAQSIQEQGVIVPVKVRPVKDIYPCPVHGLDWLDGSYEHYNQDSGYTEGCRDCLKNVNRVAWARQEDDEGEVLTPKDPLFELVYGHRRVEAARRAGLDEIEATVEGVTDTDALVQALIENIQREDMQPLDVAHALQTIMDMNGWTLYEMAKRNIIKLTTARDLLKLLDETKLVQELVSKPGNQQREPGTVTQYHVREVREAGVAKDEREQVILKAAQEGLSVPQTRRIAEAVAAAPSPEAKRVLLETEYSPVIHDPEMIRERAAKYGAHDPFYRDNTPSKQQQYDQTPEIRAAVDGVLEGAKRWNELIKVIRSMTEVGKLAPESRQFIAHRARQLAKTLTDWANELEAKE